MRDTAEQPKGWAGLWRFAAETDEERGRHDSAEFFRFLADLEGPDLARDALEAEITSLSTDGVLSALAATVNYSMGLTGKDLPGSERFLSWLTRRLSAELHERTDDVDG